MAQQTDRHWSFRPLRHTSVPELQSDWAQNPVDLFILQQLQHEHLQPSPPAAPDQRLRRLYLDLLGLLPGKDQIEAFAASPTDNHWSQIIDQLLASPKYGERWGRHWLDLAKYADSNGFEFDFVRPYAWRYRDYVISAFNSDKPYDQFIKEQLAGDEIDRTSLDAWVATGFCRNGPTVGNQALEKNRYEELHDVITATTEVFLGLTVGCARCHDHKFDPITQEDYYSMLAIFHTTSKREHFIGTPEQRALYSELKARKKELDTKGRSATNDIQAGDWNLQNGILNQTSMVNNTRVWFGDPNWTDYTLEVELLRTRVTEQPFSFDAGIYVAVRASDFTEGYTIQLGSSDDREHALLYEINNSRHLMTPKVSGTLTNQQWYKLRISMTGSRGKVYLDNRLLFDFEDARHKQGGVTLGNWSATSQWRNLRVTATDGTLLRDGFPDPEGLVRADKDDGFDTEALKKEIADIDRQLALLPLAQSITDESSTAKPTYIHIRGEYDRKGALVEPRVPSGVSDNAPNFDEPMDGASTTGRRRTLANWIANPQNPLTARVMVNRIWQYHFGRGLVETSSNFGLLGLEPTHPELLDWLAAEFIRSGWSVKHIHRLVLASATYQQSSTMRISAASDIDAKSLSRFPMRRHDAEVIRDRILQAADTLNTNMGGPGVHPRIEEEVIGTGTTRKWPRVLKEDSSHWRRSVYVFVRRSVPFPLLESFDAPVSTSSCSRRVATIVPTQALQLLNSRFVNEQSWQMAQSLIQAHGDDRRSLIDAAYWRALGRRPSEHELSLALGYLRDSETLHQNAGGLQLTYAAQDLCHVLFNLNEFVFMN